MSFCLLNLIVSSVFAQRISDYVNPMVGTGGHGHTFPGATVPFGFCQMSPDTRLDGSWDGCSGYHHSDSVIYGFSHTHLSGTGCSDYGDISFMPSVQKNTLKGYDYAASFQHATEQAEAGFYHVELEQSKVQVDLAATPHCGIQQYTYPKKSTPYVVLDLQHRDEVLESYFEKINDSTIAGYRYSKAWATKQKIFFYTVFSQPIQKLHMAENELSKSFSSRLHFSFEFINQDKPILVRTGISGVDIDGAKKNLLAEASHTHFKTYVGQAKDLWDMELAKIKVYGKQEEAKRVFYTALYHCMISPNLFSDVDGRYRGRDDKIHSTEGKFNYYTVFSLWDTYRGLHPLLTLIDKKRSADFIQTFLKQFEQGGRLPIWELSSNETNCMIGYHAVSVILDAYVKGIRNFDVQQAYAAMKSATETDLFGIRAFHRNGYLTMEDESESVSKTLEYAYNDWCIAEMARHLGKQADAVYFDQYAQAWVHVIEPTTGFARPKSNGGWLAPFDPYQVNNHYTEANSWQYSFSMPQHMAEYQSLFSLKEKLDAIFKAETATSGREQADITGLIGQYAHGNEPSHHIVYLYNQIVPYDPTYLNITSQWVSHIADHFYKNSPDGLIGNEDCGQMSAWYVLSAMGIYPTCPGIDQFALSKPLFDSVSVSTEGKPFTFVNQQTNMDEPIFAYLQSAKQGTQIVNSISQASMEAGGRLVFSNQQLQSLNLDEAPFLQENKPLKSLWQVPVVTNNQLIFDDTTRLQFDSPPQSNWQIRYTLDGTPPNLASPIYSKPVLINKTTKVNACYEQIDTHTLCPFSTRAQLHKRPNHYVVKQISICNPQYTAGGPNALVDGLFGDIDWRKGHWQGYQGQDVELIIDMGKAQQCKKITPNFLQDQKSWIFYPREVSFYASMDGVQWSLLETKSLHKEGRDDERNTTFSISCQHLTRARYVKIKASNYGKVPAWHPGAGGDSFIFIDEISIDVQ